MVLTHPMLQPVVALLIWSMLIWFWVMITRVPAMQAMKIKLDPTIPPKELTRSLPARVRWIADNYNHLMEQPTLFYAAAVTVAMTDPGNAIALVSAWSYVLLRVGHSLTQTLFNHILTRFALFVASSLALIVLVYEAAQAVF
jgi:hypothetical protein